MVSGTVDRHNHRDEADYYRSNRQPVTLMDAGAKQPLIDTSSAALANAPKRSLRTAGPHHFYKADPVTGRCRKGLGLDIIRWEREQASAETDRRFIC